MIPNLNHKIRNIRIYSICIQLNTQFWLSSAVALAPFESIHYTEHPENVCTWLREISFCSCLTVLLGLAWVLLSNKYTLFPGAL